MIGGVCGYLGVAPVRLRLAAVALTVSGGVGVLTYVIAWILVPDMDGDHLPTLSPAVSRRTGAAVGIGLDVLSLVLLLGPQLLSVAAAVVWPLVAIALGGLYLATGR